MPFTFPTFRVSDAIQYAGLAVVPIMHDLAESVHYVLAKDAITKSMLHVEELGVEGSVPTLSVRNVGPTYVLFLEGHELVGAKQNRIVNTSLLIPPDSKCEIPVSCVERGRWRYRRKQSFDSGAHATAKLRGKLKKSVSHAIKRKRGHLSDQAEVWREVKSLHQDNNVHSNTSSMSDAFAIHQAKIQRYVDRLPYVTGASGLAIANSSEVISIDIFDKASTCQALWDRIVQSSILDLDETPKSNANAATSVRELLLAAKDVAWLQNPVVGEGSEYRSDVSSRFAASALCFDGTLIHASFANSELAPKQKKSD